jgi:hypothetical protein
MNTQSDQFINKMHKYSKNVISKLKYKLMLSMNHITNLPTADMCMLSYAPSSRTLLISLYAVDTYDLSSDWICKYNFLQPICSFFPGYTYIPLKEIVQLFYRWTWLRKC